MRTKDFLLSELLERERMFIGLMSFPTEALPFVRREIMTWILIREQEISRMLGLPVPSKLDGVGLAPEMAGCSFAETLAGSVVEFAVGGDLAENGAAVRYFHYFQRRDRTSGRTVQLTNEGFMTSFLFQENKLKHRTFMWLRLEFCHSSLVPYRRINPTVPRIFKDIRERCPGVLFEVHPGSSRERIEKEWEDSPTYESIAKEVGDERKLREKAYEPNAAKAAADSHDIRKRGEDVLATLRDAVASLRNFCRTFFDAPHAKTSLASIFETVPVEQPQEKAVETKKKVEDRDLHVLFVNAKPIEKLIKRFEEGGLDVSRYRRLVLDHFTQVLSDGMETSWVSLIVEPAKSGVEVAEEMAFTALLKKPAKLVRQVKGALLQKFGSIVPASVELNFRKPIHLRTANVGGDVAGRGFLPFSAGYFVTGVKVG